MKHVLYVCMQMYGIREQIRLQIPSSIVRKQLLYYIIIIIQLKDFENRRYLMKS